MELSLPNITDIASGAGWRLRDIVCTAKIGEPAFEEAHAHHVMAVVKRGVFGYHGRNGKELLHGGSLLVGNKGNCYACGHEHGNGDHCLALQLEDDLYAEIAATQTGSMSFHFAKAQLTLSSEIFAAVTLLEVALQQNDALQMHEAVFHYAEEVLRVASQMPLSAPSVRRDGRRIAKVIHAIEADVSETLTLQQMAEIAGLSRYHFLRVFKQCVGITPHQFIMRARLKYAVELLLTSKRPVIDICYSSGFGDLSTFNRIFKSYTGMTPRMMRN